MLRSLRTRAAARTTPVLLALLGGSLLFNCYFLGRSSSLGAWLAFGSEVQAAEASFAGSARWVGPTELEWKLGVDLRPPETVRVRRAELELEGPGAPRLEPSLEGQWFLVGARCLRFRAERPARPATAYRVHLGAGWTDAGGRGAPALALDCPSSGPRLLHTAAKVIDAHRVRLDLRFDQPIELESLRSRVELVHAADGAARLLELGRANHEHDLSYALFELPPLTSDHEPRFTLLVRAGVAPREGQIAGEESRVALRLDPHLDYGGAEPFEEGGRFAFHVRLGGEIDLERAREHVSCEPPRELALSSAWDGFVVRGAFGPGERIKLRFAAGLPGLDGRTLPTAIDDWFELPDLAPSIAFASSGAVLLASGRKELELELCNTPELELRAWRLFPNQIANWSREHDAHDFSDYLGEPAGELELRPALVRNRPTRLAVELESWLSARAADGGVRGTYFVRVRDPRSWHSTGRVVTATDLAITARRSEREALLWVTEIGAGRPAPEVEVEIRSASDQVLARGRTDALGKVLLQGLDARGSSGGWIAFARRGDDLAFLELEAHAAASERDAAGRPWREGVDAFVFVERGLVRPGEALRFGGWLRDEHGAVRSALELQARLERPDGKAVAHAALAVGAQGWFEGRFNLAAEAPTGRYRLRVHDRADHELGATEVGVEDFRPDRLRVGVSLPAPLLDPGELELFALARIERLSGGAASQLRTTARLQLRPSAFRPPSDARFAFAPPIAARELPAAQELEETRTDAQGLARFALELEERALPRQPVDLEITATGYEPGGRAVTGTARATIAPEGPYLACAWPAQRARPGQDLELEVASFTREGKPAALDAAELLVERLQRSWVLRRSEGGAVWESVDQVVSRHAQRVALASGSSRALVPGAHLLGRVRWSVRAFGGAAAVSAHGELEIGGGSDEAPPEEISLAFEPASCAPGAEVALRCSAPFGGSALLTLEGAGFHEARVLELPSGESRVALQLDPRWRPTVHAALSIVRAHPSGGATARAIGRAKLSVLPAAAPQLELVHLERVRPGEVLDLEVRARGAVAGDEVALWAIDEAVLALSGEELPDPRGYFFGAKSGRFETRDPFARLLPELGDEIPRANGAVGGDEDRSGEFLLQSRARPERESLLGAWIGRLELDAAGRARLALPAAARTGALRLVALLATREDFARAESSVAVRDELELELALPGALAPGDRLEVPIALRARELASAGELTLELRGEGGLALRGEARMQGRIERDGEAVLWCALEAREGSASGAANPGALHVRVEVGGTVREGVARTVVRRAEAPQLRRGALRVERTARWAPADELSPLPRGLELELASAPWIGLEPALRELIAYPWGCLEQVLSRARPLLELEAFAAIGALGELDAARARAIVQSTLDRLLDYEAEDGGLALWPGSRESYGWGSLAALDFALLARARGHVVDEALMRRLVVWCERRAASRADALERCAAIEVLARAGRDPVRWLEALRARGDELEPEARAILARAFGVVGRLEEARELLPGEPPPPRGVRERGGALRSDLRATAQWLLAALELERSPAACSAALLALCDAVRAGEVSSTQDGAWVLRAIARAAVAAPASSAETRVELRVPGASPRSFALAPGEVERVLLDVPTDAVLELVADGGAVYAAWTLRGFPRAASSAERVDGVRVARRWLAPNGAELEGGIAAGDLVLVELQFECAERCENAIAIDPLPAGFEIENPRLKTRDQRPLEELPTSYGVELAPQRVERLADRLALFADLPAGKSRWRYLVRAVQPGSFSQAPLEVQAAYDPRFGGRSPASRVEVRR
ncbi:MAG: hypothetical protein IPN34_04500 [Planctomycetes bacterium]|nr:hypothetical protein [Planctomycetota bacterium]